MRYLARYILLPLVAVVIVCIPAHGQIGKAWWYPFGTPEGNRRLADTTKSQIEDDIHIKWRTTALKNAPVILTGALRGTGTQQIVGIEGNVLTILSERGMTLQRKNYGLIVPPGSSAVLTGLFDADAASLLPTLFPNRIGIGVEGAADSDDSIRAFLANAEGTAEVSIPAYIPNDGSEQNRWARLYPVGAFKLGTTPIILGALSQDRFQTKGVAAENNVRRYRYRGPGRDTAKLEWSYPIAPAPLPQPPALAIKSGGAGEADTSYIAVGTSTYPGSRFFAAPTGGVRTWSDTMYSVTLRVDDPARPVHIDTRSSFPSGNPAQRQGETHTYVAQLFRPGGLSPTYRIITENHDPARPGSGGLFLVDAFRGDTDPQGFFRDTEHPALQMGWSVIAAQLDGTDQPENRGDEIVATWQPPDGSDVEDGWLYVLGTSFLNPGNLPLTQIAKQRFNGRLMAAGDLVRDTMGRQELVVVRGDTLRILQLKDYDDESFADPLVRDPQFFRVMKEIRLDSRIISVALAEIDGDGENDIIVSTLQATYAIGRPLPNPFDAVRVDDVTFCRGDSVTVKWGRTVGGGEKGVSVSLSRGDTVFPLAPSRATKVPDSLKFHTEAVPGGSYRIVIRDLAAPDVADSSVVITVHPHEIYNLRLTDPKPRYDLGDSVRLTGIARCFDGEAKLVRQVGSSDRWDTIPAAHSTVGSTYNAAFELRCPEESSCTPTPIETFKFRFVSSDGTLESDIVEIPVANLTKKLNVTPPDSGSMRRRTVNWDPDEYGCDSLSIVMLFGTESRQIAVVPNTLGSYAFEAPRDFTGKVFLCAHCTAGADLLCATGRGEFVMSLVSENFAAPNPFDPTRDANDISGSGALINFLLTDPATVSVTIYDASRGVVRRLVEGMEGVEGTNKVNWDGRNSRGEIVANGTYICVIELDSREPIILPIVVLKR